MELLSNIVEVALDIPRTLWSIYRTTKRAVFGKRLDEKVVLVTGASSGIGRALSKELYRGGCRLILASRDVEALHNLRKELLKSRPSNKGLAIPDTVVVVKLDLSNDASTISAASEAFSTYGRVDVLINCAGVSHRGSVNDTDVSVYKKVMQINYFGPVLLTSEILKLTKVDNLRCHVVNVSSLQGLIPVPFRSAYCASKHALHAFSDSLRMEINSGGSQNALVTVVSPGYVKTNLSKNALTGSGEQHGVLDANTRDGLDASYVATEIVNGISLEEEEIIVAKLHHSMVVYLKRYFPGLFFRLMELREVKSLSQAVSILTPTWFRSLAIKDGCQ